MQIGGKRPHSFIEFTRQLMEGEDQHEVALEVQRGGEQRRIAVRMVPEKSFFNAELIRKKTGASLQELTPELAQGLGLGNLQGLVVAGVERGSPAATGEVQNGMVVTRIDGQNVTDMLMAAKLLHAKGKGEKCQFELVVPRQRGRFLELRSGTVELKLR